jgi:hypothetical protein
MTKSLTRRIIAIMFSACGAGTLTYLATTSGDATALIGVVGIIIGFYFGVAQTK